MNRRDLLLGAAGLAAVTVAGTAGAEEHMHHHMASDNPYANLIKAAQNCQAAGDACMRHCIDLTAGGDTTLAECLRSANEMMILCSATTRLAGVGSRYAAEMIATCQKVCEWCEKECRKHEKKHETCKACADACAACVKECKLALAMA